MRGMITSERPIAGNPNGYISLRSIPLAELQWTFWLRVWRFKVENNNNKRLGLLSAEMSSNQPHSLGLRAPIVEKAKSR